MVSFKRHTLHPASPDITPLLDVVFILLIFFVISAVFTAKGMNMELPPAESAKAVSGRSMEIELRASGDLICDTQPITLHDLSHKLRITAEKPLAMQPEKILLKSAPQARVEQFVRVIDLVQKHGFSNLVIVTGSKDKPREAEDIS
ncbi:MAG: biopolymer transporter ExbD [Desulfocurvibacter africanus]